MQSFGPEKSVKKLINNGINLSDDIVKQLIDELNISKNKHREDEIKTLLLYGVVKMFANEISKNDRKNVWNATIPEATYDDIFMKMCELFFKHLPNFEPNKAKLSTWAFHQIKPVILNPVKTFRNKFNHKHKPTSMDKEYSNSDGQISTLADKIEDTDSNVQTNYFNNKEQQSIMKALGKLKPLERDIIMVLMKFKEAPAEWKDERGGVNKATIARAIGKNKMYVQRKVESAQETLRKELEKYRR